MDQNCGFLINVWTTFACTTLTFTIFVFTALICTSFFCTSFVCTRLDVQLLIVLYCLYDICLYDFDSYNITLYNINVYNFDLYDFGFYNIFCTRIVLQQNCSKRIFVQESFCTILVCTRPLLQDSLRQEQILQSCRILQIYYLKYL